MNQYTSSSYNFLTLLLASRVVFLIVWVKRALENSTSQGAPPGFVFALCVLAIGKLVNGNADFSPCACLQTMPQGYTMYGTQMPLQQTPQQQAGSVVLSPTYNSRTYPAAHSNPALMERLRQMQQPPSGYVQQQASAYLQPMTSSQRWCMWKWLQWWPLKSSSLLCFPRIWCFIIVLMSLLISTSFSFCCLIFSCQIVVQKKQCPVYIIQGLLFDSHLP